MDRHKIEIRPIQEIKATDDLGVSVGPKCFYDHAVISISFYTSQNREIFSFISSKNRLQAFTSNGSLFKSWNIQNIIVTQKAYTIIHDMKILTLNSSHFLLCCGNFPSLRLLNCEDLINHNKSNPEQIILKKTFKKTVYKFHRINEELLAAGSFGGKVIIFNTRNGFTEVTKLEENFNQVYVIYSVSNLFFVGGVSRIIHLYDMNDFHSFKYLGTYSQSHRYGIRSIASFRRNNEMLLVSGGYSGMILIWNNIDRPKFARVVFEMRCHQSTITEILFVPSRLNHSYFFSSSHDGFVCLWKLGFDSDEDEFVLKKKKTLCSGTSNCKLLKFVEIVPRFGDGSIFSRHLNRYVLVAGENESVKMFEAMDAEAKMHVQDQKERFGFLVSKRHVYLNGVIILVRYDGSKNVIYFPVFFKIENL